MALADHRRGAGPPGQSAHVTARLGGHEALEGDNDVFAHRAVQALEVTDRRPREIDAVAGGGIAARAAVVRPGSARRLHGRSARGARDRLTTPDKPTRRQHRQHVTGLLL
jgi:hypothetical protein